MDFNDHRDAYSEFLKPVKDKVETMPVPDVSDPDILPLGIFTTQMPWVDETNVNDPEWRKQFMFKDLDMWNAGIAGMGAGPSYNERVAQNKQMQQVKAAKTPAPGLGLGESDTGLHGLSDSQHMANASSQARVIDNEADF